MNRGTVMKIREDPQLPVWQSVVKMLKTQKTHVL